MAKYKILVVDAITGGSGTPGAISQVVIEFDALADAVEAYEQLVDSIPSMVTPGYNCNMSRNVTRLF